MSQLAPFLSLAGRWSASYVLQDPEHGLADNSASTATVTSMLSDRFVRIEYTWAYKGAPQEGSILIGCEPSGVVTAVWIDSFHNGRRMMVCTGSATDDGGIDVRGSYPAAPGPDWGWRTQLTPSTDAWTMTMFNVWPDGREDLAVKARYERN